MRELRSLASAFEADPTVEHRGALQLRLRVYLGAGGAMAKDRVGETRLSPTSRWGGTNLEQADRARRALNLTLGHVGELLLRAGNDPAVFAPSTVELLAQFEQLGNDVYRTLQDMTQKDVPSPGAKARRAVQPEPIPKGGPKPPDVTLHEQPKKPFPQGDAHLSPNLVDAFRGLVVKRGPNLKGD
jgi:hypothetical protein